MKYLLMCLISAFVFFSFSTRELKHAYVFVQADSIRVTSESSFSYSVHVPTLVGYHEGPELICVNCGHRKKQVIYYEPISLLTEPKNK